MEKLLTFNQRRRNTSYELLQEGAKAHTAMPRLRAEAERIYPLGSAIYNYVFGWLDEVEIYIVHSTAKFEQLSELEAEASLVGELSLNEMIRRRDRLNERIELLKNKGNIIPIRGK